MSARRVTGGGYILTVKLKFDKTSVENMRKQLDEAMDKVFQKRRRTPAERKEPEERGVVGSLASVLGTGFAAKIGAIAGAVAAGVNILMQIAQRVLEFSPAFKQLLRLVETTIGLLLKPIFDIIALLLRPVLIALLRYVIIPFYMILLPFLRSLAKVTTGQGGPAEFKEVTSMYSRVFGGVPVMGAVLKLFDVIAGALKDGAFEGAKSIQDALSGIATDMSVSLSAVSARLVSPWLGFVAFLHSLFERVSKSLSEALVGVVSWLGFIWKELGNAWNSFVGWISANLGKVGEFLGAAWNGFVNWLRENLGKVSDAVGGAWSSFVVWLKENLGGVGEAVGRAWSGFVVWVRENMGKVGEVLGGAWSTFVNWVSANLGRVGSVLGDVWSGFVTWVRNTFGSIGSQIGAAWNHFVNWINENMGSLGDRIGRAWNNFVKWVQESVKDIDWSWFSNLFGFGRKQFGGLIERPGLYFLEAGERVIPAGRRGENVQNLSFNVVVNFSGTVYGMEDIRTVLRRVLEEEIQKTAGRALYSAAGGRVRVFGV